MKVFESKGELTAARIEQLVEQAQAEGWRTVYLRAMTDEGCNEFGHMQGDRLQESRCWGDVEDEDDSEQFIGGVATIYLDDYRLDDEDYIAERLAAVSDYQGNIALVGVNEEMDKAEGIWFQQPFNGEDAGEMVVPNARFYCYL